MNATTESWIEVNVSLYGSLAKLGGGRHVAQINVRLPSGSCKADLINHLGVPQNERGYLFINAVLCDVPGLTTESTEPLHDGDHIGIFSSDRLWPYQYRDGVRMSEELKKAMQGFGAMHHSYQDTTKD
jgi:hypothetical protein